ncbi:MAG: alpha/beta fold hydrolase [Bacteroidota bacterium]
MSRNLILLHGALGAAVQFSAWIPLLEDEFVVHTLDLEGHGSQPFADRAFRIGHFTENLQAYIEANGLLGADIFGYSMGGYVALDLARKQPGKLGRIHTFATKLAWSPETAAKEVKMLNPDVILAKVPKFAAQLETRHSGNDWRENLQRTADLMLDLGEAPVLKPEDLAAIEIPVRMGIGDRDNMVSIRETEAFYRHLPQGEMVVLPRTPHPLEKMDPVTMTRAIREYFRE